ncbi:MAG: hypothetical protein KDD69_03625 [Bdellovibrionales bacterium]|nr:hypothetical protein [Bdellovibrionales bacterium]
MLDDILIILNEREAAKQQLAEDVVEQLEQRGLAATRLVPRPRLSELIRERAPRLVVLDYLLGDYGTAVDVLQDLKGTSTAAILFTDEPSLRVAVSAMKAGALDYIEIGSPRALERLIDAVAQALATAEAEDTSSTAATGTRVEELVATAPASRAMIADAATIAAQEPLIAVLLGPPGAGRSALARFIHTKRHHSALFHEVEVDLFTGSASQIFGTRQDRAVGLASAAATVVLEHADCDTGELADAAKIWLEEQLGSSEDDEPPLLLFATRCPLHATALIRLLDCKIIEVPPLSDRHEDALELAQAALRALPKEFRKNTPNWSSAVLDAVLRFEWPGNVRQFLTVLSNACAYLAVNDEVPLRQEFAEAPQLPQDQHLFVQAVYQEKLRWERYHYFAESPIEPLAARMAVDATGGNLRVAAAGLGIGVPQLRTILGGYADAS